MILEKIIKFKSKFNKTNTYKDLQIELNSLKKELKKYEKLGVEYSANIDDHHHFWMKPRTEKIKRKLENLGFKVNSYRL